MEFFRKIADKAREAKTQFDENRRVEKESALSQTEQRLDALNAQLEEKAALLATKERTLHDEESRLRRLSRRPMYVLLACTLAYGAVTVMTLNHYELVAREAAVPANVSTVDAQPERQAAPTETRPSPPTNRPSERDLKVQETYRGIDVTRPSFDVGGYCLNEEKKGHITFEQCLGIAAAKIAGKSAR